MNLAMTSSLSSTPLWISHRGYRANAPENTFSAFNAATGIGFTALETDLRLTKDRHLVLIHDETIARLTGDRIRVRDLTRRQLESYRLAGNERFLFFDRFADAFDTCNWTLDIKPEAGLQTISALAEIAGQSGALHKTPHQVKFLTWSAAHESRLKSFFPRAVYYGRKYECWRAGLAVIAGLPVFGAIQPGRIYALPPAIWKISLFKASIVRQYHIQHARTIAYLPETDAAARRAVRAGFDEILTNKKIVT